MSADSYQSIISRQMEDIYCCQFLALLLGHCYFPSGFSKIVLQCILLRRGYEKSEIPNWIWRFMESNLQRCFQSTVSEHHIPCRHWILLYWLQYEWRLVHGRKQFHFYFPIVYLSVDCEVCLVVVWGFHQYHHGNKLNHNRDSSVK